MRFAAIALLAVAAGSAYAQLNPDEKNIGAAFSLLRQNGEIMLELNGTEQVGARTTNLYSNAYFKWDSLNPDSFAKSEINDFVNNVHTHRIVGDGQTLWSYDFNQNAYSAFHYGAYSGPPPEGFRLNLLQEMTSASKGQTVVLARMLREIFGGVTAQYTTWLPMATVTWVGKGTTTESLKDPIANRTYVASDQDAFVVYTYATRPQRSASFHLTRADLTQPWSLSEIYYADLQRINASNSRFVDWTITVHTSAFPFEATYIFKPPTTARPIANVKGGG
ncbi:MAG TPA: hypothetical protein VG820_08050 [Fimbriimonadaceae bacterium]|nr:hypothetical protein [Fimbriimonadaceae bacterium]